MYQLFLPWKLGLPFKICLAPKNKKVKKKKMKEKEYQFYMKVSTKLDHKTLS